MKVECVYHMQSRSRKRVGRISGENQGKCDEEHEWQ